MDARSVWTIVVILFLGAELGRAQVFTFTREQMMEYTTKSPYERFPDGRPKVPDAVIEKLKNVLIEEGWGLLRGKGFPNQYEGDWKVLNSGTKLVGRAVTVQFMPVRADVAEAMEAARKTKNLPALRNQTVIDMLEPGDVAVVDLYGKIESGTFVGDKLAHYIWRTTGTGLVVDGAMFWLPNIEKSGMPAYYRGTHPSSLGNVMLTGINVPIRVGDATVMPGDVVLGDGHGLLFIPPQLAEEVVKAAETTQIRDEWMKQKFDTRKYKSSDIYGRPRDPALAKELEEYIKKRQGNPK
jgi:4-hydroxy-4-methyl-2-oxoglutarate aldolase